MMNLIRLEMRKTSLKWYFQGAIIAILLILALIFPIQYVEQLGLDEMFIIIGSIIRATFIVFGAVLLSKLIIEEYRNKTIYLMYTYPIKRKKLIAVKLLLVGGLTFITIVLSSIFITIVFFIFSNMFEMSSDIITTQQLITEILNMIVFAIAAGGASLIPLYFGLRKQSVAATIISSLLVVIITNQHSPGYSSADNIYISIAFAIVGIFIALWTIRDVDKVDVI